LYKDQALGRDFRLLVLGRGELNVNAFKYPAITAIPSADQNRTQSQYRQKFMLFHVFEHAAKAYIFK
jgi:hypothetical protein